MNEPATDRAGSNLPTGAEAGARERIARAVVRARRNLFWETLWPLIAPLLTLAALFAAVSWLGLWRILALPLRVAVLAAFAAAAVYFLARLRLLHVPSDTAAFARVEHATGIPHRPATALTDRLAGGREDPAAEALWQAHRRRLLASLTRLSSGSPAPGLSRRDPLALRFLAILLFVVGFVVAGPERLQRLSEAFRGGDNGVAVAARIDAWVTPPAYTGRPPLFLTGDQARTEATEYAVPAGSLVTVRTGGTAGLDVTATSDTGPKPVIAAVAKAATDTEAAPVEHQITLTTPGRVAITGGGREIAGWHFAVQPDRPPAITLVGDPEATQTGALHLTYSLSDDYGVVSAYAAFAPLAAAAGPKARPLYESPSMQLTLPRYRIRDGNGETTRDLSSHPWAGARVTMTLVARDEAGQEGRSQPIEVTLPARRFNDLLARAVVEQRTKLALDANAAPSVLEGLDAMTMAPDKGIIDPSNYLAVRSAFFRLQKASSDDELRNVADYLWSIANGIEDGDMSFSAEDLRAAEEALRQALENNASDAEIARLTQQLREALDRFLQSMMQAMQNQQAEPRPMDPNAQVISRDDLQKMLDHLEELARTGARDAARELLSQLQNMMENLQAMQRGATDPNSSAMMQGLNQLGDMIRRQQDLMNQTYRAQRGQNPDGSGEPMTKEQLEQALRDLAEAQEGLGNALKDLMQQLPGGEGDNGKLGQAGRSMGRAADALGNANPGGAVGEQGNALDALRQGAQGLQQQLAQQQGMGPGNGRGGMNGNGAYPNTDPLGRPQRSNTPDLGSTVKVPDEIDTQRAREILDAIRRRLGESGLPTIERDYLERLLEKF